MVFFLRYVNDGLVFASCGDWNGIMASYFHFVVHATASLMAGIIEAETCSHGLSFCFLSCL